MLLALLITWLVGETRGLREDLIADLTGTAARSRMGRISGKWMLAVALVLGVGALIALRVQFRGKSDTWEEMLLWGSLGLGFVGVGVSVVLNVLATSAITRNAALVRGLGIARRTLPVAAAMVLGVLASPLVRKERPRPAGAKFAVYGTCLAGGCGLKQRSGPGPSFPEVNRHERLKDGHRVLVICQTDGPPPPGRYKSRVWDLLRNGRYVSDAFVDTPNRSGFSSALRRCKPGAAEGTFG